MNRIERFKGEILELKNDSSHRACLRIHSILNSNNKLFSEALEPVHFQMILKNFEDLSNRSLKEVSSAQYKDEFRKSFENLSFHLNRV